MKKTTAKTAGNPSAESEATEVPKRVAGIGGRPRVFTSPKKLTLLLEAADAEQLSKFVGWRRSREGKPVSQARALLDALFSSPLYRKWKDEEDHRR